MDRRLGSLVLSATVAGLGAQMTRLALPWFVLISSGSATRMGLVLAVSLLPLAIFGFQSGRLIEKVGPRRALMLSYVTAVPLLALVPLLLAFDGLAFGVLLVIVFALGAVAAPAQASQRLVLAAAEEDGQRLARANTLLDSGNRLALLLGPLAAGALIVAIGPEYVLLVDAGGKLLATLLLSGRGWQKHIPGGGRAAGSGSAGLRFLRADAVLRPLATITVLGGVLTNGLVASLPVLALEHYRGGAAVAGWLVAALGAGTVAGSLLGYVILGRVDATRLAVYAFFGVGPPLLVLSAGLPLTVALAALMLTGACASIVNAPMLTLLTLRTPAELRSSVMAAIFTLALLGAPLGFLLGGWALEAAGPALFTLALALAFLGLAVFFAAVGYQVNREQPALAESA